jgi:hypothetical protein
MIAATQVAVAKIRVVAVPILAAAMARAAATSVAAIAATADAATAAPVLPRSRKLLLLPKLRLRKKPLRSHPLPLPIRVLGLLSPARWSAPASFAKQLAIS